MQRIQIEFRDYAFVRISGVDDFTGRAPFDVQRFRTFRLAGQHHTAAHYAAFVDGFFFETSGNYGKKKKIDKNIDTFDDKTNVS